MTGIRSKLTHSDLYSYVRQEAADRTLFTPAPWFKQTIADLKRHEGFYEYAYPDPLSPIAKKYPIAKYWGRRPAREVIRDLGISNEALGRPWTYGYGFTRGVNIDSHIHRQQADRLLEQEIYEHMVGAELIFPAWKKAPMVVQSCFANLMFNMGLVKMKLFTTTMKMLREGRYAEAGENLKHSAWYKQVGVRSKELTKRLITGRIEPEHQYKD